MLSFTVFDRKTDILNQGREGANIMDLPCNALKFPSRLLDLEITYSDYRVFTGLEILLSAAAV
jgi:hypothetical protein